MKKKAENDSNNIKTEYPKLAMPFGKNLHELNPYEAVWTVNNRSFMYYVHVCGKIEAARRSIDVSQAHGIHFAIDLNHIQNA